jgi:hypothetical protein
MDTVTWKEEAVQDGQKGVMTKTAYVNPFMRSFVARNPSVPAEQVQDRGPDPFLKQLNSGEEYSIYKCKKPWTLAVAVFQSPTVIQSEASSGFLDKLMGKTDGALLTASAQNAHNLAKVINESKEWKEWNLQAYVFHTRNNSVVTINGYGSKDDPALAQMAHRFRFKTRELMSVANMLPSPMPMEVPR